MTEPALSAGETVWEETKDIQGRETQCRSLGPGVQGPQRQLHALTTLGDPQVARDIPDGTYIPLGHSQSCLQGLIKH